MCKKTVRVYDTITKKYVDVKVSDDVYTYFNRTQWNIDDNDETFYKHEIQFSTLIGNNNGAFENFKEFVCNNSDKLDMTVTRLYNCLDKLKKSERELIEMLYFLNMTEQECADELNTSQQNIHNINSASTFITRPV